MLSYNKLIPVICRYFNNSNYNKCRPTILLRKLGQNFDIDVFFFISLRILPTDNLVLQTDLAKVAAVLLIGGNVMVGLAGVLCLLVFGLAIGDFSGSDDDDGESYGEGEGDGFEGWEPVDPEYPGPEITEEPDPEVTEEPDPVANGIYGTDGDDTLQGSENDDDIFGLAGADDVQAGGGADYVEGGDGNDVLNGQAGDDELLGGEGDDVIYGEGGSDTIDGGAGSDQLFGDWDDDTVLGGDGNDEVKGGSGDDLVDGGEGDDIVHGGLGIDTMYGGAGDDILVGEITTGNGEADVDGADMIYGGDGNDVMSLGNGDEATGGTGNDTFITGGWVNGEAPTITDYTAADDQIVVNYDEAASPNPVIEIESQTEGPDEYAVISLDGVPVCRVAIAAGVPMPLVSDIALVAAVW